MRQRPHHATRFVVAGVLTCTVLLTSCGSDAPGEQVPELAEQLSAVDDALASESYPQARQHLQDLVATTEEARGAGELDDAEADRVLAAAARLLAELPGPSSESSPSTSTAPDPTPEPTPTEDSEDPSEDPSEDSGEDDSEDDKDDEEGNGKPEDAGEGQDEEKDEDDDKGNSDSKGKGNSGGKGSSGGKGKG